MNTLDILFIIGLPRSGTSLVHKLVQEESGRKAPRFKDFGIDVSRIPQRIKDLNPCVKDNESLAEDNDFDGTLAEYRKWLELRSSNCNGWVCKSPDHIGAMPELLDVFPEARFLWCLRDLDKTRDSIIEYFQVTGLGWTYDPNKALEEAYRQCATHPEKFDYMDVESIPEWNSDRPKAKGKFNFWDVQYEVRGIAHHVQSSQFKERYRIV